MVTDSSNDEGPQAQRRGGRRKERMCPFGRRAERKAGLGEYRFKYSWFVKVRVVCGKKREKKNMTIVIDLQLFLYK